MRALDRVLVSGYYVVPLFYLPDQWVARWNTIEHPEHDIAHRLRRADLVAEAGKLAAPSDGPGSTSPEGQPPIAAREPGRPRSGARCFAISATHPILVGMSSDPVTVDVISDVVCPWCYLGKRRLARAIGLLPEIQVIVHWRPFRLDPTIPPEGVAREDYLTAKFGSVEALTESHRQLTERGREEGIDYHFDRITRSPNTVDAHRLVRWAAADGVQDDMVERLFAAYFSEGLDIGDPEVLAELSADIGFEPETVAGGWPATRTAT